MADVYGALKRDLRENADALHALRELVSVYDYGMKPSERCFNEWLDRWDAAWKAARQVVVAATAKERK